MTLRVDRLKALREERGWSQRELARRCGFAPSLVGPYENGTNDPSATYLKAMADQFDVSADYLLGRSDDRGGQIITIVHELTDDEREFVARYRKDGLHGLARLVVDRLAGKGEE